MDYTMSREIGNHGKAAEAHDVVDLPGVDKETTSNPQATSKPFPFLSLPAEIRNKIYRLLLLTQNVSTYVPTGDHTYRTSGEIIRSSITTSRSDEGGVGTLRCECWRTYTLGYQVSILRINRKIYGEAWGIFHFENFWTFVWVNKAEFGQEMKDRGFPVVTGGNLWRHVRSSVMKVTVTFPGLDSQKQSDTLLIATVHLNQLMRVLWTAKGAPGMAVKIDVQPPLTKNSPSEGRLLRPFRELRSIKQLVILGVSKRRYVDQLKQAITTTDGINQTWNELTEGLKCLQGYIKTQQWGQAIAKAEKHSMLMADSQMVYGIRLIGIGSGLRVKTILARRQAENEITIATAMALAEVTLHLRQYTSAIRFANNALHCMSPFMSTIGISSYLQQVPHTGTHTGILTSESETKCIIHLIRARAHMAMQQARLAFNDIQQAQGFMRTNAMLTPVYQAWQIKFGPYQHSRTAS